MERALPVIAVGLSIILTYMLLPSLNRLFIASGLSRVNFGECRIPTAMGVLLLFVYLSTALILFHWFSDRFSVIFMLGLVWFGLLGFLDDLLGSPNRRGLRGHLQALSQGELTTGGIKALGGVGGALFLSMLAWPGRFWWELVISVLLIALTANTINLFDLRPGRAAKLFLVWDLLLLIPPGGRGLAYALAPLAGGILAYLPFDLGAAVMLGDTGANLLGYALGMVMSGSLAATAQVAVVSILILLHIISEQHSLTGIIEGNSFLRYIDNLGRAGIR